MKVLAVIPARYASTRFLGKPLVEIRGKSMIRRVYDACLASNCIDDVVVATDDQRIYEHLLNNDARVIMTSPSHENGTGRVAEVVKTFFDYDVVLNIQGDEPCIHVDQINELLLLMQQQPDCEIGTLAKKITNLSIYSNKNVVKVCFENNIATSFCRVVKKVEQQYFGKHIGIYAFRKNILPALVALQPTVNEQKLSLEQLRWMDNDYEIAVAWTDYDSPSVDIPDDVHKVELFIDKNGLL